MSSISRPSLIVLLALSACGRCGEDVAADPRGRDRPDIGAADDDGGSTAGPDASATDAGAASGDDAAIVDLGTSNGGLDGGRSDASDGGRRDATIDDGGATVLDGGTLTLSPPQATLVLGEETRFTVTSSRGEPVRWSIEPTSGTVESNGTITVDPSDAREAVYRAPEDVPVPGRRSVVATLGGAVGRATVELENPVPTISAVVPERVIAGSSTTTIRLLGAGLLSASVVELDGVVVNHSRVSNTELEVELWPQFIAQAGQRRLSVTNRGPGGGNARATLWVIFERDVVSPAVDPRVPGLFDGAVPGTDLARRPVITYPEDRAESPLDFPAPEVSWSLGASHNICRVRFTSNTVAVDLYVDPTIRPAFANPSGALAAAVWRSIVSASLDPHELTLEVSCAELVGLPSAPTLRDGIIDVSDTTRYEITREAAGGRIVYFSGLIEGLWRIDIGGFDVRGEPWIGPSTDFRLNSGSCVGCHSFSRDGSTMSFGTYINDTWEIGTALVSNEDPSIGFAPGAGEEAVWSSLHPNGRWILATDVNNVLRVLDANDGSVAQIIDTGTAAASLAVWAPSGDTIAYTVGATGPDGTDIVGGTIYTASFNDTTGLPIVGSGSELVGGVVAGGGAFYPSFSPDGRWIAFCRAPSGGSYNNLDAELWLLRADGSTAPVRLDRANRSAAISNSWPRWAPTSVPDRYWLVFSSQRPYPPLIGVGPQQLWVTHLDTNVIGDPSHPAIWLSGQEPFTGNLTAEWTTAQ